jgi:hypothetical protein
MPITSAPSSRGGCSYSVYSDGVANATGTRCAAAEQVLRVAAAFDELPREAISR